MAETFIIGEEKGKLANLRYKIAVIEILRFLKQFYSYKELSSITGVNDTALCRYIKGAMLPSIEQARNIWRNISAKVNIIEYILRRGGQERLDLMSILSEPIVLRVLASKLYLDLTGRRITLIVTRNSPIISLATTFSLIIDKPIIIISDERPLTSDYIVEKVVEQPDNIKVFFIPKRYARKREDAIVIWDVARNPMEVRTLVWGLSKVKIDVRSFVSLISLFREEELKDLESVVDYKYFILIRY